jgi:hypothetical protein
MLNCIVRLKTERHITQRDNAMYAYQLHFLTVSGCFPERVVIIPASGRDHCDNNLTQNYERHTKHPKDTRTHTGGAKQLS